MNETRKSEATTMWFKCFRVCVSTTAGGLLVRLETRTLVRILECMEWGGQSYTFPLGYPVTDMSEE